MRGYGPNKRVVEGHKPSVFQIWTEPSFYDPQSHNAARDMNAAGPIPLKDYPIALAFSPDEKTLAVLIPNEVLLCNVALGRVLFSLPCRGDYERNICFSHDGQTLAVPWGHGYVYLFETPRDGK